MNEDLCYQVALTQLRGIGPVTAKYLVSYCGGVRAVFEASKKELLAIPNVGASMAAGVLESKAEAMERAEREVAFLAKKEIKTLWYLDSDYPRRLKRYDDCPPLLYYRGQVELNHPRTVAIVGTRKPTDYGLIHCEKLVEGLLPYGVQIVSGLAYGVDSCAHQAAVQHGIETIGIVGHGLDMIYPAQNRKLAAKMEERGAVMSQFLSETKPDRENFPMRNRVIAAMADVVVVIESKKKGGSIITAMMANEYSKDVFALPGKVNDPVSEGCNKLIKEHKAHLLESAKDIAYIMRWEELDGQKAVQASLFVDLNPDEETVIDAIRANREIDIDTLSHKVQMPGSQLASVLLNLEFKGMIKTLPGKKYIVR